MVYVPQLCSSPAAAGELQDPATVAATATTAEIESDLKQFRMMFPYHRVTPEAQIYPPPPPQSVNKVHRKIFNTVTVFRK